MGGLGLQGRESASSGKKGIFREVGVGKAVDGMGGASAHSW